MTRQTRANRDRTRNPERNLSGERSILRQGINQPGIGIPFCHGSRAGDRLHPNQFAFASWLRFTGTFWEVLRLI